MRQMLDIEFAHLRVYINQVALVAVVKRGGGLMPAAPLTSSTRAQRHTLPRLVEPIPAHLLQELVGDERPFIEDIIHAAQMLLSNIEELCPDDATAGESLLRCAPSRAYVHMFTIASMLLKVRRAD